MVRFSLRPVGILLCFLVFPTVALAENVRTPLDFASNCQLTKIFDGEAAAEWICEGFQDIPVWVSGGSSKFSVSYGVTADKEPAATQTLEPDNRPGRQVEWVLEDGEPVATILRWITRIDQSLDPADAYRGEVLVVTQLGQGQTCHIGYVDALANRDPHQLARDAANLLAGIWDCSQSPKLLGRGGRSLGF
ncbi:hypothetical protein PUV47_05310 [Pseudovibrio exalbescens]|uniref:hypothetical protein n=1 Tax=Pseudovibrio exalbescens TaxID=197461 RepID=UPI0023654AE9|nr:hypothetical protein [Pseudovibrio exalbescens]MDD7909327.1 hypothetical protein [Pseudovibrio exalbescens]